MASDETKTFENFFILMGCTKFLRLDRDSLAFSETLSLTIAPFSCLLGVIKSFLGSVAVHLSEQHFLDATLNISIERKSGAPRFEPGAGGCEAQTLPLC